MQSENGIVEEEFQGQIYKIWINSSNKSMRSYFRCFKRKEGVDYLHRKKWESVNGEIPHGYDIHHIDGNTLNNEISNLELISKEDHKKAHIESIRKRGLENAENGLLERIRPLTKEWHESEEGSKWHSEHAKNTFNRENHDKIVMSCSNCSEEYIVSKLDVSKSKFCSNKCRASARRKSGVDNVKKVCDNCGGEFIASKYAKGRMCSRKCAGEHRRSRKCV